MNPDYQQTKCRYCNSQLPKPFLELGSIPLANSFLTKDQLGESEFTCPLSLCYCSTCGLVQLSHVVPPDLMFSNYLYVSSTTQTFRKHFADYAKDLKGKLLNNKDPLAVDIGSNDGLLLECYKNEGFRSVGVEPAKNLSKAANDSGRITINRYFDSACVKEIIDRFGRASVVSANNVFAHIHDVQSVCKNISNLLTNDGIFVLEFPYLMTMVEEMLFDMIYHEHLSYISVNAVSYLFQKFGLEIFDINYVSSHGGSLRVYVQNKNGGHPISDRVAQYIEKEKKGGYLKPEIYNQFAGRVQKVKDEVIGQVKKIKSAGQTISGYGAPAKGNTLLCYCDLNTLQIDYIVDDNPLKQNHFTPGTKIPVVPSTHLKNNPTNYVIIFAWNFAPEIMEKLKPLKKHGVRFMVPLPRPTIV